MDNNGIVKVAIYTRVSTQEQAVEGTSLVHQLEQLKKQCQSQGWQITGIFEDGGYSGKDGERPGLKRMLVDASFGLFTKVLVYKMDRLARSLKLLLEIEEKLRQYQVSFCSISEGLDSSTATGRHFIQMMGIVAEWEREAIIERTKSGIYQRYMQGCWAGGKPAFGYNYDRETKKLVINEEQAKVIRRIFKLYASGKSLCAIATTLNNEQVPAYGKNGKGWRSTGIRRILLNTSYKGILRVKCFTRKNGENNAATSQVIEIPVPPIITDEKEWSIAQQHLSDNKSYHPTEDKPWLLQGLIRCGSCGLIYGAEGNHGYRYYSCRGKLKIRHLDGSPRCKSRMIKAEWLENELWQKVESLINDPNKLKPLLMETVDSLRSRTEELQARIRPIDNQLAEIARKKEKLADQWVQSNMNQEKYRELKRSLDDEEARLKSIRHAINPAELEELETTLGLLRFWEGELQSMAWNTENEDGTMYRLVNSPHKVALKVVGFEDKELSTKMQFPASKRELLDKLQVRLAALEDRVEVKALFPIEPVYRQEFPSARGQGMGVDCKIVDIIPKPI